MLPILNFCFNLLFGMRIVIHELLWNDIELFYIQIVEKLWTKIYNLKIDILQKKRTFFLLIYSNRTNLFLFLFFSKFKKKNKLTEVTRQMKLRFPREKNPNVSSNSFGQLGRKLHGAVNAFRSKIFETFPISIMTQSQAFRSTFNANTIFESYFN